MKNLKDVYYNARDLHNDADSDNDFIEVKATLQASGLNALAEIVEEWREFKQASDGIDEPCDVLRDFEAGEYIHEDELDEHISDRGYFHEDNLTEVAQSEGFVHEDDIGEWIENNSDEWFCAEDVKYALDKTVDDWNDWLADQRIRKVGDSAVFIVPEKNFDELAKGFHTRLGDYE